MLPTSPNTVYVPGVTPVKANDLNDVQDCIVGGKHGDAVIPIHSGTGFGTDFASSACF